MKVMDVITFLSENDEEAECVVYSCPRCHDLSHIDNIKMDKEGRTIIDICTCNK